MLKAIRRLLDEAPLDPHAMPAHERRHLQLAVAVLVHEARRADYAEGSEESAPAEEALAEMFRPGAARERRAARAGPRTRAPAQQLLRASERDQARLHDGGARRLIEHLWRVTFADGRLDLYEDHYVRKIAHLLYVPNTQSMLARNRAKPS